MRELVLLVHLGKTLLKLCRPGGLYAVAAESLAVKHQLQVMDRSRRRAPRLTPWDRLVFGLCNWLTNLHILNVEEIKTIPFVPQSHPFVERVIGTLRREYLDYLFFWKGADLEQKLLSYRDSYNQHRCHSGLRGQTPNGYGAEKAAPTAMLESYQGLSYCRGMFQLPAAA